MSAESADELAPGPVAVARSRPRAAQRVMLVLIRWYQGARAGRPSPCRYLPSCSEYAAEAITVHGAIRGGALAARRLGRCHPWGGQGFDPVPEKKAHPACSN